MQAKMKAIPFPDFKDKNVLDIGCDYGQFSFLAAIGGATVLGLDRNRDVKGIGFSNLIEINRKIAYENQLDCHFEHINLGKSWKEFSKFDHILVMSVYHHIFENCGDHKPIWFWLWRHCRESVIWEGPLDDTDKVVQMNVTKPYTKEDILDAAHIYFDSEYIGPALHEPNRHVYVFRPKKINAQYRIRPEAGTGGATKAFQFENERRMDEIESIVGYRPYPGSLNCIVEGLFDFSEHYYPGEILDIKERGLGLEQDWAPKEARFYPVSINEQKAHVIRMKGDPYPPYFIEFIAPVRLRDSETTQCKLSA